MYLCLVFPLIKKAERRTVLASFLQDFGVLGAVFALAYPPGLMYPYWTLTLHSFIWHFLLFFIGTFCAVSGLSDRSSSGWRKELPLFFACCAAALAINTAAGPEANADMFLYFSLPSVGAARFPPDRRSPGNPSRNPNLSGRGPWGKPPDS